MSNSRSEAPNCGVFRLLAWLLAFAIVGTWMIWRPGVMGKLVGSTLVLLGIAPSIVVLVMLRVRPGMTTGAAAATSPTRRSDDWRIDCGSGAAE
jgi:hypothetical protein